MRALVVGLGHMGTFHRRALRDLGYVVDAVDPRPEVHADYASTREAMMQRKYDVAAIAVPADQLVACAFELAGTKMLVEKPFAETPEAAAMLGAYLTARAPVCVGYVERFNPVVRELHERLRWPHVRAVRFTRHSDRPSRDPVSDLLTHDVDLARYLLANQWGERAVGLCAFDARASQPTKRRTIEADVAVPALHGGGNGSMVDETWTVDLMDHDTSPLHAMWHAFLTDADDVPGPRDAVAALLGAVDIAARDKDKACVG